MKDFIKQAVDYVVNLLDGRKTYAAGIALVVLGLVRIYLGDLPGGSTTIAQGLGLIFVREAVAKAQYRVVEAVQDGRSKS